MRRDLEAFTAGQERHRDAARSPTVEDSTQVIRTVGVLDRQAVRRPGWLVALALALLVGGLALGTWSLVTLFRTVVGRVEVPKVVERDPEQAEQDVALTAGLDPSFQENEFSTTVAEGDITRQEPPSGTQRRAGQPREVLGVEREARSWRSPNVVGQTVQQAAARLSGGGPTPSANASRSSARSEAGTVLRQNPRRRTSRSASGDTVDLTSRGARSSKPVPNVIGLVGARRRRGARERGIPREAHLRAASDRAAGARLRPGPAQRRGREGPGSVIDIFVSRGTRSSSRCRT